MAVFMFLNVFLLIPKSFEAFNWLPLDEFKESAIKGYSISFKILLYRPGGGRDEPCNSKYLKRCFSTDIERPSTDKSSSLSLSENSFSWFFTKSSVMISSGERTTNL